MNEFLYYSQTEVVDCGPACIKMICMHFEMDTSIDHIKKTCKLTKVGASLYNLQESCKIIGIDCIATKLTLSELFNTIVFPCILLFYGIHYIVVPPQDQIVDCITVYDPNQSGIKNISIEDFVRHWIGNDALKKGYALIFGTK